MKITLFIALLFISIASSNALDKEKEKPEATVKTTDKAAEKKQVLKLIKDLGSDSFKTREDATNKLLVFAISYKDLLQEKLKSLNDIEAQERIKIVLYKSVEKLAALAGELVYKSIVKTNHGKYKEALEICNQALAYSPNLERAITQYCKIQLLLGNYKKAIDRLEKNIESLDEDDLNKESKIITLTNYCIKGKFLKRAQAHLEKALSTSRYPEQIQAKLAIVYENTQQLDKAELNLKKLIKSNITSDYYVQTLAWFYLRTNQPNKAKESISKYFKVRGLKVKDFSINDVLNHYYINEPQKALGAVNSLIKESIEQLEENELINLSDLNSNNILFSCVWYYLNHTQPDNKKGHSKATIENFKTWYTKVDNNEKKSWPLPLLGYYGGVLTDEQFFEAAKAKNAYATRQQLCEAYYYAGLKALTLKDKVKANKYFQKSVDQKVFDYIETTGSLYELNKKK